MRNRILLPLAPCRTAIKERPHLPLSAHLRRDIGLPDVIVSERAKPDTLANLQRGL